MDARVSCSSIKIRYESKTENPLLVNKSRTGGGEKEDNKK